MTSSRLQPSAISSTQSSFFEKRKDKKKKKRGRVTLECDCSDAKDGQVPPLHALTHSLNDRVRQLLCVLINTLVFVLNMALTSKARLEPRSCLEFRLSCPESERGSMEDTGQGHYREAWLFGCLCLFTLSRVSLSLIPLLLLKATTPPEAYCMYIENTALVVVIVMGKRPALELKKRKKGKQNTHCIKLGLEATRLSMSV